MSWWSIIYTDIHWQYLFIYLYETYRTKSIVVLHNVPHKRGIEQIELTMEILGR